jgi:hypothetical protein
VPVGAVAAAGIVIAASAAASASVPSLSHRSAAQLLAGVGQAAGKSLGPLTATVQQTADLGLPQLPQVGQSGDNSNLTAGTHSITIWYRDPRHIRIAEPVQDGESDMRLNGRTLWLWSSKTQTATRLTLPADATRLPGPAGNGGAPGPSPNATSGAGSGSLPETPLAAASQVLKAVGPSTVVGVQSNVFVANRPAYQLALEPRSDRSLVGKVLIAIDASRQIPLRVEVFGRGSAGLAYSIGFTSLAFGTPAASNFSFTPPPGATVKNQAAPGSLPSALKRVGLGPASLAGLSGGNPMDHSGFSAGSGKQVKLRRVPAASPVPKKILARINAKFAGTLPASMTKAQRAKAIKMFDAQFAARAKAGKHLRLGAGWSGSGPLSPQAGAPRVIGKDWLSVIATPPSPQVAAAVKAMVTATGPASQPQSQQTQSQQTMFGSSSSSASSSGAFSPAQSITAVQDGSNLAALRTLLLATTPVHGSWGSGRLLQTKLLSVLITSKGQILAGAVTPAMLYADVAADAR